MLAFRQKIFLANHLSEALVRSCSSAESSLESLPVKLQFYKGSFPVLLLSDNLQFFLDVIENLATVFGDDDEVFDANTEAA